MKNLIIYCSVSIFLIISKGISAQTASPCSNIFDIDGDSNVAVYDFYMMLSAFGDSDDDDDGIWDSEDDCSDPNACNYDASPSEPCAILDAIGVCGGDCIGDSNSDGICDVLFSCGDDVLLFEGYEYSTELIGEQCWFSENCRYLPEVSPSSEGSEENSYYYVYDYDGDDVMEAKSTSNYEEYGVLYNFPAVISGELCPSGWHIPTDEEWQTMEMSLGMDESDVSDTGWRGGGIGYQMKSNDGWSGGGDGSNSSGFNGMPSGFRNNNEDFDKLEKDGVWWSSTTSDDSKAWYRGLNKGKDKVDRDDEDLNTGYSARCLKD